VETRTGQPRTGQGSQVMCASCGRTAEEPPLTWSRQTAAQPDGEPNWLCETCTREHLWAIEGKLDTSW
jgi:hypothetical protein